MDKEKIIEKIKDKLLENALAEYENMARDCDDIVSEDRSRYTKEYTRLSEERIYLMQDYEDIMYDNNIKEEDLNFDYNI